MHELEFYLRAWCLKPDGEPFETHTATLLPVTSPQGPAMLKYAGALEEEFGFDLLEAWNGNGAARILARKGAVVLMERATGSRSLGRMATAGADKAATTILCNTARRLHAGPDVPPARLIPLDRWFAALEPAADRHGGLFSTAHRFSRSLIATSQDVLPLHGDLHHENVLDFGERGFLAIDPKGLIGERYFEYCCLFTNPDMADPDIAIARAPERFAARLQAVCEGANLDPMRLLQWLVAWCGLSAVWFTGEDAQRTRIDLDIAAMALGQLQN
ncbi:APH(6) family putative aminoglycoside O-phosphotransferase [Martelella alba]|uniref:APH(6) family putative aminoglycoside O-phosphotransferase n=1 Tax=Martelella alba TaxID=2590451 RepID=A0A506U9U9_9HYPH|nr:aminoglycoside phosphotransferase family protein [Martelella alba]TPW29725.1 APH(6) family putative aminoglycoside O-phosphotransferase [Martelella alba]